MLDPFLAAHWTAPRIFDMSGRISPISIRDQMMRGRMLADRLIHAGIISNERDLGGEPNKGLLVVGAGAGGMTAALRAAEQNIPTVVLERGTHFFPTQKDCLTRWLDPYQYDWPMGHWIEDGFPFAGADLPLHWNADRAHQVVAEWLSAVRAFLSGPARANLTVEFNATLGLLTAAPAPKRLSVPYQVGSTPKRAEVGAMLLAVGFGSENTQVKGCDYRSFAFWETDPFEFPNVGLSPLRTARVLVSGGGDGALQDFMRIMTGLPSAKAVLQACDPLGRTETMLQDAERVGTHGLHWANGPDDEHDWHMLLDSECRNAAQRILHENPSLTETVGHLLEHAPKQVKVIFGCEHLTPLYLLNRFVAHLINEYLERVSRPPALTPRTRLLKIFPHTEFPPCDPQHPARCHGVDHRVLLEKWPDCRQSLVKPDVEADQYNVIVVRHGITAGAELVRRTTPLVHTRQVLPYYLL